MRKQAVLAAAHNAGFELAGIAPVAPLTDFTRYRQWVDLGHAGSMAYLTDHRAALRSDVRTLLPTARSVLCVGKLYNTPPPSGDVANVSRYAWGSADYHDLLRHSLEQVVAELQTLEAFDYRICVDTAPVLERSLAREAGLGWIGRNTCLINQPLGSWFFLAELITSLDLEPDQPAPDRCGTCTACIDACPTQALSIAQGLDARLCISYLTIESRGPVPSELEPAIGQHVFGCDICQTVCPWNRRAPVTDEPGFQPQPISLDELAALDADGFRQRFRKTPVARTKHEGLARNVAIALKNRARDQHDV
jgi:epoxyqueuosine reductase